jgi:hypothetical protein
MQQQEQCTVVRVGHILVSLLPKHTVQHQAVVEPRTHRKHHASDYKGQTPSRTLTTYSTVVSDNTLVDCHGHLPSA